MAKRKRQTELNPIKTITVFPTIFTTLFKVLMCQSAIFRKGINHQRTVILLLAHLNNAKTECSAMENKETNTATY